MAMAGSALHECRNTKAEVSEERCSSSGYFLNLHPKAIINNPANTAMPPRWSRPVPELDTTETRTAKNTTPGFTISEAVKEGVNELEEKEKEK